MGAPRASEGTRARTPRSPEAPTRCRHRLRRAPSHIQLQRPVHHLSVRHDAGDFVVVVVVTTDAVAALSGFTKRAFGS